MSAMCERMREPCTVPCRLAWVFSRDIIGFIVGPRCALGNGSSHGVLETAARSPARERCSCGRKVSLNTPTRMALATRDAARLLS
jgi:hypothetical protein